MAVSRADDVSESKCSVNAATCDSVRLDEMQEGTPKYWLVKAEPDSRIVKGKDVKACPHTAPCMSAEIPVMTV